jgi:hypothetical protein
MKTTPVNSGIVTAICICPVAGGEMHRVESVEAIKGAGLRGDRYESGEGSFNKGACGKRQVTLINGIFFESSGFEFTDSRRNIITQGVELMYLIGKEFLIGTAQFRGIKYCEPCLRPTKLSRKERSFQEAFFDRGGLIAEVIESGVIEVGSLIIPPAKDY